jgi:hypothetical protein
LFLFGDVNEHLGADWMVRWIDWNREICPNSHQFKKTFRIFPLASLWISRLNWNEHPNNFWDSRTFFESRICWRIINQSINRSIDQSINRSIVMSVPRNINGMTCWTALHCTARHGTARHSTARHSTVQHSIIVQFSPIQYNAIQCRFDSDQQSDWTTGLISHQWYDANMFTRLETVGFGWKWMGKLRKCDLMIRMRSLILLIPSHLVGVKFIWFRCYFIRIENCGGEIRSFIMILRLFVVCLGLISWEQFNFSNYVINRCESDRWIVRVVMVCEIRCRLFHVSIKCCLEWRYMGFESTLSLEFHFFTSVMLSNSMKIPW